MLLKRRCCLPDVFWTAVTNILIIHPFVHFHSAFPVRYNLSRGSWVCPEVSVQWYGPDAHVVEADPIFFSLSLSSVPDTELEHMDLEADSLLFMKSLTQSPDSDQHNGFCPPNADEESCDVPSETPALDSKPRSETALNMSCPVGLHKGALLYPDHSGTPFTPSFTSCGGWGVCRDGGWLYIYLFIYTHTHTQIDGERLDLLCAFN